MNTFRPIAVAGLAGLLAVTGFLGSASPATAAAGASGRPDCPNYAEHDRDWVQFGFTNPKRGSNWRKTAVLTQHPRSDRSEAMALARRLQICFEAPYWFPTRSGYGLARHGEWYTGVLADCSQVSSKHPCLLRREVVERNGGWSARLVFLIPPSDQDPKAMG